MRLRFGGFVFDSETREVIRGDEPQAISPKAFALLALLIESRPKAVSKADIHSRLWPDTHVSGQSLGNLVVELREALGEDARKPRSIRTVARFGYAFSAKAVVETDLVGRGRGGAGLTYRVIWGRREISLDPGDNLIGRDPDAVVWIDDDSVSRRHARIAIGTDGATIEDLGSKNGTWIGGAPIRGPVRLADRDVVTVGPARLRLRVLRRVGSTRSTIGERHAR
jgi:DNA-binding winged helix-turn-helix (wHTH) protein